METKHKISININSTRYQSIAVQLWSMIKLRFSIICIHYGFILPKKKCSILELAQITTIKNKKKNYNKIKENKKKQPINVINIQNDDFCVFLLYFSFICGFFTILCVVVIYSKQYPCCNRQ